MGAEAEPQADLMLQAFIRGVNMTASQVGIALLVGGTWISGTLISPRMFTEELRLQYESLGMPHLEEFFGTLGTTWFPSESEAEAGFADDDAVREQQDQTPMYLHLRHGRSVTLAGCIPDEGAYLRVRVNAVEAWSIGDLGPPGYAPPPPPVPGH